MSRLPIGVGALEIFAEAGRLSSFKGAAETLALSTSAVSQAIRKLEKQLGCELFRRVGNGKEITPEGRQLLTYAESGLEQMRAGLRMLRSRADEPLSISSPPGIASQLLSPVIQSLLASDVSDIRFAADETPDFVSYQAFDVAILYGEAAAQHHDLESLGPDVFTPVCHRSVADRIKTAADLMRYPLVVNESNAVSWSDWFEVNGLAAQGGKWLRFNRVAHIIPVLLEGVGIGLESLRLMSPYLERGELLICPLPGTSPISRELTFLHVTRAAGRRPRAEHVARLIRDECATNADGLRRSEAARRPQVEPSSEHGHFSHSGKSPGK